MEYNVEIKEILSRVVEIEADDKYDAVSKVQDMYREGIFILDSDDYTATEILIYD